MTNTDRITYPPPFHPPDKMSGSAHVYEDSVRCVWLVTRKSTCNDQMKHWVTFDLSTVFFWQRKLIKPFTCKSIGKTFFSFSNDYPQPGSSRWGGFRLTLRRRQICKNCISQKIENKYLLHEIHWLKTGYSDVFYVSLLTSVCFWVFPFSVICIAL